jgi:hypothetical protein
MDALGAGLVDFRPEQNDGVWLATIVPCRSVEPSYLVADIFLAGGCSLKGLSLEMGLAFEDMHGHCMVSSSK